MSSGDETTLDFKLKKVPILLRNDKKEVTKGFRNPKNQSNLETRL
jgi:hypothetical protein